MAGFTPKNLVDFFKAEIPEYIGTYTYKDGSTTEAIAIDNIPNEVTVEGFEIIIPGFPKMPQGTTRQGRRSHICQYWDIDFINHDSNRRGSLARKGEFYLMIDRVTRLFPRVGYGMPIPQGDPRTSLQRYRLTLKLSDTYDNPLPRS